MKIVLYLFTLYIWIFFLFPNVAFAENTPEHIRNASVWVVCDGRQGSGTIIQPEKGYILTNGHVALNHFTGKVATYCDIGFADQETSLPRYFTKATIVNSVFLENHNQDFAVLKLSIPISRLDMPFPPSYLKTNEFAEVGDDIYVTGYSGVADAQTQLKGKILAFRNGYIETDAEVVSGDSGGTLADKQGNLIGVPTRIVSITTTQGALETRFEHVDIRPIINWMDTLAVNGHDEFIVHADSARYHQTAAFINQEDLGCFELVRSLNSPSIYCLLNDGQRLAFPNGSTFLSWFGDFQGVKFVEDAEINQYILTRNATFRPGTLVKTTSSPKVYVVTDSFGTLRYVPDEAYARNIWGANWANLIFDIPDEFFAHYTIGQPIE